MTTGRRCYLVIPARSGSVRVPQKNLRTVCGRSLLSLAIDHARVIADGLSGLPTTIVVSSDGGTIHEHVRGHHGIRYAPRTKLTETYDPVEIAVLEALTSADPGDLVILLQPTSPLRDAHWCAGVARDAAANRSHGYTVSFSVPELRDGVVVQVPCAERREGWLYHATVDQLRAGVRFRDPGGVKYPTPDCHWARTVDINVEDDLRIATMVAAKQAVL